MLTITFGLNTVKLRMLKLTARRKGLHTADEEATRRIREVVLHTVLDSGPGRTDHTGCAGAFWIGSRLPGLVSFAPRLLHKLVTD